MESDSLIQNFGGRGERLFKENVKEQEIIVKIKGTFGEGLVITKKRLYVFKWGFMADNMFGGRCNAFEFRNIVGLEIRKNWQTGTFEVLTSATQNTQKGYWDKAVQSDNIITFQNNVFKLFTEAVIIGRDLIGEFHTSGNQPSNYAAELEKLAELNKKGIISDEEFQAKKKQILGL